ncbi:MAG: ATP-dependent helicase [Desulfobulbaceae bacterium]|nr:ATP-dependent helicase [Desulfobulbaceae bacterium]
MNLTDEQLRIINHSGGHARVSAVAGSGKTTTMVARVGQLLQQGASANQIMVLMFNKSARDSFEQSMQNRLSSSTAQLPEVRTFHSLGMRLVKSFTKRSALPAYSLVTEDYVQEKLARQVANEVYRLEQENDGWLAGDEVEEFLAFIDRVKSTITGVAEVFKKLGLSSRYSYFIGAYKLFEKVRKQRKIRFYADLIHEPLMAMLADSELAAWVTDRVEHVIVDEYQDINEAQQQLLKILAGNRAKVMVVGDVDQCIYEWRGARPEYITTWFQKDFQKPDNYQLSYTFRYGHQLSLAANHLIAGNRKRDQKLCISHDSTEKTVITCLEEQKQHPALSILAKWRERDRSLQEAVVLVRLFAQSVPVELALLEAGIPYRLEGNAQVFDCPEVLALTGYLKLVLGTMADDDQESREQMITAMLSQPHLGIKREEMVLLVQSIAATPQAASELLRNWTGSDLPPFIRKRFEETAGNWCWLADCSSAGRADALLKRIVQKLKLYDFYHNFSARSATAENRVKTCQAFIDFAAAQNLSVGQLLEKIAEFKAAGVEPTAETLLITSVHRSKGLEWPLVILPGLAEGSFPFYRERDSGVDDLEDERRLFYVAMTRAIEQVVCIHPVDADLKRCITKCCGKIPRELVRASRFLYEANPGLSVCLGEMLAQNDLSRTVTADDTTIAKQYLDAVGAKLKLAVELKEDKVSEKPSKKILEIHEIAEGLQVWHHTFGAGTVLAVKDRKQGRLKVLFEEHGEMILLAAYAKLQPF